MMTTKAGEIAGAIWGALNENGTLTGKELKKAAKLKNEKELYLGLGWLMREDKVFTTEEEKDITVTLK
ncbi:MAG: winged helix-turn-helix domain-containing protein [Bacteroidales bacterium]|nr:winged helix-turn-helix domain-containing protein [Candidatus Equimonas faecalis]